MVRFVLIACVATLAVDALGSATSETLEFEYGYLWPVSTLVTLAFGFRAGREFETARAGLFTGAWMGATESTVGWALSWVIGPGAVEPVDYWIPLIAIVVIAIAAIEGLIGGWLGRWTVTRRPPPVGATTQV